MSTHNDKLVKMANDIGDFFKGEPDRSAAVRGMVEHLNKFWEPRMRQQIIAHYREGAAGLSELAKEAVKQLEQAAPNRS